MRPSRRPPALSGPLWQMVVLLALVMAGLGLTAAVAFARDRGLLGTPLARFALERGAIVVYDENRNSRADREGDTWVFDPQREDKAKLAVVFRPEGNGVAYLYDDQDGNGQVDLLDNGRRVLPLEQHWRVKVSLRTPGWFTPDGRPNWNLDLVADTGYQIVGVDAGFGLVERAPQAQTSGGRRDGYVDLIVQAWDQDNDGVPDLEWNNVSLTGRFDAVMVNKNPRLSLVPNAAFPLLDTVIKMDWDRGQIQRLDHLIPTRSNEEGYFIYFIRHFPEGTTRHGWENPFAFYDLHGDGNGEPELAIRTVTEEYVLASALGHVNEVRYSWVDEAPDVDYRLYLLGRLRYEDPQSYPLYPIAHIPYERLPYEVTQGSWLAAIFAHNELHVLPQQLGEGIYENGEFTAILRERFLRNEPVDLPPYLPRNVGIREEFRLGPLDNPRLYFSPVDRRLHLRGAEGGILVLATEASRRFGPSRLFSDEEMISGQAETLEKLLYQDKDGDGYLDSWTYYQQDQPVERLVLTGDVVIYGDTSATNIKRVDSPLSPALFETLPPRDPQEWSQLRERLAGAQANTLPPHHLRAMFESLVGDTVKIPNAVLQDWQPRQSGFGLALRLIAPTVLPDALRLVSSEPWPTGDYFLRYDGRYSWQGAAVTRVELPSPFRLEPQRAQELDNADIGMLLRNPGPTDARLLVRFAVRSASGAEAPWQPIETVTVLVPGEGEKLVRTRWAPPGPGRFHVQGEVLLAAPQPGVADEAPLATLSTILEVASASRPSIWEWYGLGLFSLPFLVLVPFLGVLTAALATAAAYWGAGEEGDGKSAGL